MTVRSGQLDWLLVEFVRDTPGVVHAIVVSGDGLRLATSPGVTVALGDQLAAAASGGRPRRCRWSSSRPPAARAASPTR